MHWVIQDAVFSEVGWDTMIASLERFGIAHSMHKVVPFSGDLEPEPTLSTSNVMCMGSYSMRHTARRMGWVPGVFDLEPFDFRVQLEHWGRHMLNADSLVVPFGEVSFGHRDNLFIRPIHDSKHFAGAVLQKDAFRDWQRAVVELRDGDRTSLRADTLVQVAAPKEVHQEARFWVVNEQVVASSMYRIGTRKSYTPLVDGRFSAFASELVSPGGASAWNPLPAFCLDVCDTPEGLRVVEINTINSSGFYAADVPALVAKLEASFSAS